MQLSRNNPAELLFGHSIIACWMFDVVRSVHVAEITFWVGDVENVHSKQPLSGGQIVVEPEK